MLVLSRKTNESIHIDGDIRIKVVAIQGNTVRLGIEAPDSVGIYREEIYVRVGPRALAGPPEDTSGTAQLKSSTVKPAVAAVGRGGRGQLTTNRN